MCFSSFLDRIRLLWCMSGWGEEGFLGPGASLKRHQLKRHVERDKRRETLSESETEFSLFLYAKHHLPPQPSSSPQLGQELKEKKEKLEEKTVCKEKKKEIIEDEENGAEEEEENPEDVDEEEAGEEDEDGDENGQEQDGHAAKRSAEEEEEDEVDPKRQKTENGSSA
ncbi:parathymosin isoform X1 [Chrysemys picta bellii]|uniref:parathymosin isoform X1 n=1 Tax=Chrysemys picta bellii TaxID=8478 RepID=UPI001C667808|nr:parathymosin isoform X1 [Chrysemys picta bellii]